MKKLTALIFIIFSLNFAQDIPKHEFRGAWVATVSRLDWPRSNWSSAAMQNEIIQMADSLVHNGFNAIIFQVRPECDAFYESAYEPWSRHLTGTSGQAPSPYFDPLEAWINAAHERGMELHAWFNPYRVTTSSNPSSLHASHVYHQHPNWLLSVGSRDTGLLEGMHSNTLETERDLRSSLILNPGMQEVTDYVINVFMDVVNNYDVDAVHMDDYFYPYGGMSGEDQETFNAEPRGFSNIEDWRRDNINRLVQGIHDSIQVVKPWVKYGVSPFGIWKSGYPSGIVGTSSYHELYCDPMAWLGSGSIDYLTPQLYWEHGGGQDYGSLMPWWADSVAAHNRHLYVGHAPYRMVDWHNWPAAEVPSQIRLNRNTMGAQGSIFFRLRLGIVDNPKGFLDSLDNDLYRYPALMPPMPWIDDVPPNAPQEIALVSNTELELSWNAPEPASDDDDAYKYVVYSDNSHPIDASRPENILKIVSADITSIVVDGSDDVYGVSTLDRLGNESELVYVSVSSVEQGTRPESPVLLSNFPNPFNPSTTIRYSLEEASEITLSIHDLSGREVAVLDRGKYGKGTYSQTWNGRDDRGVDMSAGIYLCRLRARTETTSIKILYLK